MPKSGSAAEASADPAAGASRAAEAEADPTTDADEGAARRADADGRNCWAQTGIPTAEAVMAAPAIVVVNALVVRRKPRLLAFLGLALRVGPVRRVASRCDRWGRPHRSAGWVSCLSGRFPSPSI